jgi:hypothetical protein
MAFRTGTVMRQTQMVAPLRHPFARVTVTRFTTTPAGQYGRQR